MFCVEQHLHGALALHREHAAVSCLFEDQPPVRRPGLGACRAILEPLDLAGAVGGFPEQSAAVAAGLKYDPRTIRRPQREVVDSFIEGELCQRLPLEIPDPDIRCCPRR